MFSQVTQDDPKVIETGSDQGVGATKRSLPDRQRSPRQRLSLDVTLLFDEKTSEIVQGNGDIDVHQPEAFFANGKRFVIEPFGVAVSAEISLSKGDIVESGRRDRMLRTVDLLMDGKYALKQALGFRGPTLFREQNSKIVEADGDVGMIRPQNFFPDGQAALRQLLGFGKSSLRMPELA